ncbi:helix-turn-helix transcriptional regulator [Bdellovibrio sp. NC01]|uniref:helix-turn-helix domain-containing protein n=1 Tax=Bdellovibrio sp. NC01 TaxID=2220073 RepID=UPI001159604B|nr:helix-turn-helix transcriptional regulator [Bdellovibrio sp. NC01]QDK38055.1 hypothetical protein DOE51_10880 [Bdellovibrio sp. NC01]
MSTNDKSKALLHTLRNLVKNSDQTYEDLARKMDLSADTIKRLLSGKIPISLERVSEICDHIGIDVFELARLAKFGQKEEHPILSLAQEKMLAEDEATFAVYYLITMGFTFDRMLTEYTFSKVQLTKIALKLEKLGILELHPNNKLKMLVYRKIRWHMNGPLHNKYMILWATSFAKEVYQTTDSYKYFFNFPLSNDSKAEVLRKIVKLCREIEYLSEMDLNVRNRASTSMNLLIGARQWMPEVTRQFQR